MPRPSEIEEKRKLLQPIVARAFAELGYRRATTAEIARRCGVRENILYRIWPDKKAMFVASIAHVYEQAADAWRQILADPNGTGGAALRLLKYEADHYGEAGLHRIIFAGLSETDDPDIRDALQKLFTRFHRFIKAQVRAHRDEFWGAGAPDDAISAWAIVGLGNVADIGRELGLLSPRARKRMLAEAGRLMLDGRGR